VASYNRPGHRHKLFSFSPFPAKWQHLPVCFCRTGGFEWLRRNAQKIMVITQSQSIRFLFAIHKPSRTPPAVDNQKPGPFKRLAGADNDPRKKGVPHQVPPPLHYQFTSPRDVYPQTSGAATLKTLAQNLGRFNLASPIRAVPGTSIPWKGEKVSVPQAEKPLLCPHVNIFCQSQKRWMGKS